MRKVIRIENYTRRALIFPMPSSHSWATAFSRCRGNSDDDAAQNTGLPARQPVICNKSIRALSMDDDPPAERTAKKGLLGFSPERRMSLSGAQKREQKRDHPRILVQSIRLFTKYRSIFPFYPCLLKHAQRIQAASFMNMEGLHPKSLTALVEACVEARRGSFLE